MVLRVSPVELAALPAAFAELEAGRSVALLPPQAELVSWSEPPEAPAVWMGVTSSGSTGRPKLIWRRWEELRGAARRSQAVRGWVWASPFEPASFAGVQAAVQAWANGGRALSLRGSWPAQWQTLAAARVDAVSATPTFMDLLVQNEPAAGGGWAPRQITLGGEPLRPGVGRRLAARFPETRFTVIYAAAEFGVLLKTHRLDGWYELDFLKTSWPEWRVCAGALELCQAGVWRSTGDQVEVRAEAIRVIGRIDSVANVAGTKVNLAEVAEFAEQVPGVLRAVAMAESNAVTGQVVCLRFAVASPEDAAAITARLQEHLRQCLRKEAWPRRWTVDEVAPAGNAKRVVR
jgi:acyl-coenzyme A synthetase/AMP-(fatty) acid ligase